MKDVKLPKFVIDFNEVKNIALSGSKKLVVFPGQKSWTDDSGNWQRKNDPSYTIKMKVQDGKNTVWLSPLDVSLLVKKLSLMANIVDYWAENEYNEIQERYDTTGKYISPFNGELKKKKST